MEAIFSSLMRMQWGESFFLFYTEPNATVGSSFLCNAGEEILPL